MKNFLTKYRIHLIIFFLALLARLFLFFLNLDTSNYSVVSAIHGDDGYYEISQGILNGHGFTGEKVEPFTPNPLRPPVWPYLSALMVKVFGSYNAVLVFELLAGSTIPLLGMYVASKLTQKKGVTIGVGILLAFEPYGVLLSSLLYSETCFTLFFLVFCIFLIKYFENKSLRNLIWMSVFLGIATLVKPTTQYVPIVLAIVMLWDARKNLDRKIVGHVLLSLALFFAIISPWIYRNYVVYGKWGMSAQPAFNVYVYLAPTVLSYDNHTNFKTEYDILITSKNFDPNTISLTNGDYYKNAGIAIIKEHKIALVKSVAMTIVTFFTHDGMLTVFENAGIIVPSTLGKPALVLLLTDPSTLFRAIGNYALGYGGVILLVRFGWYLVTFFFFFGVYKYIRREKRTAILFMIVFLVAYFALTTSINGLGVNARFRVPVNTFIFTFALYGLFSLKKDSIPS